MLMVAMVPTSKVEVMGQDDCEEVIKLPLVLMVLLVLQLMLLVLLVMVGASEEKEFWLMAMAFLLLMFSAAADPCRRHPYCSRCC